MFTVCEVDNHFFFFVNHLENYFARNHPINSQCYASGVDMLNGSFFERDIIILGKSNE